MSGPIDGECVPIDNLAGPSGACALRSAHRGSPWPCTSVPTYLLTLMLLGQDLEADGLRHNDAAAAARCARDQAAVVVEGRRVVARREPPAEQPFTTHDRARRAVDGAVRDVERNGGESCIEQVHDADIECLSC